jgi:hypothetical protein
MKSIFNVVLGVVLIGFAFITSCKETIPDTVAEVRVIDENGEPVPFADIIMACTSSVNKPCEIEIFATADKNGVYVRNFDLPKVLEVTAAGNLRDTQIIGALPDTTMIITKDSICGVTFISIKPEQTSVQTITLYECK